MSLVKKKKTESVNMLANNIENFAKKKKTKSTNMLVENIKTSPKAS